jgi:hypothetical protein
LRRHDVARSVEDDGEVDTRAIDALRHIDVKGIHVDAIAMPGERMSAA